MSLRRRPKVEKVRHELRGMPPELMLNAYGEEIVRLRGALRQALDCLTATGGVVEAKRILSGALEREGWWR